MHGHIQSRTPRHAEALTHWPPREPQPTCTGVHTCTGTYNHTHRDTQRLLPTGLQETLGQHTRHVYAQCTCTRVCAFTHLHTHLHTCTPTHMCTHVCTHTHRLCTACLTENGNLKGPQKGLPWRLQKGLRLCQGPPQGLGMVTLCPGPASRPSWPSAKASQWRAKAQGGPSVALGQQEHPFLDTLERARRGQGQGLGSRVGAPEPDCPAQPTRPQSRATALPGFLHLGGFP